VHVATDHGRCEDPDVYLIQRDGAANYDSRVGLPDGAMFEGRKPNGAVDHFNLIGPHAVRGRTL